MSAGSGIVVIGGVRYRRDDAERRGLLSPAPVSPEPEPLTTSTTEPEAAVDSASRGFLEALREGLSVKGRKPKNKAADPEDK